MGPGQRFKKGIFRVWKSCEHTLLLDSWALKSSCNFLPNPLYSTKQGQICFCNRQMRALNRPNGNNGFRESRDMGPLSMPQQSPLESFRILLETLSISQPKHILLSWHRYNLLQQHPNSEPPRRLVQLAVPCWQARTLAICRQESRGF